MADKTFEEFVRREQEAVKVSNEERVNWQVRKAEWLQSLDELYSQVDGYLKPYIDAGQVAIAYGAIQLNEEHMGPYSAKEMLITIGSKTIKLEPIGALIFGSRGRVDLVGILARAQLLLLNSELTSTSQIPAVQPPDVKWVWRIVTRPPRREIIEINEITFLNLLVEISNG